MEEHKSRPYSNLNIVLNDYCLWMENTSFLNNLGYFYDLTIKLEKYLRKNFTPQQLDTLAEATKEKTRYLSLTETLDLVTEYIDVRLPEYKEAFIRSLSDGTINLVVDPDDDENEELLRNFSSTDKNNHVFANVVLRHDTTDPVVLIHEFMHSLNNKKDKNRVSRRYIAEAISIYFELDMIKFLMRKGFSKDELEYREVFRFADFYTCVEDVLPKLSILNCFYNLGPIDNDSYMYMQSLNLYPRPKSEGVFYNRVNYAEKMLREEKEAAEKIKVQIDQVARHNPLTTFGYIIGTLVAYYVLEQDDEKMHQTMIDLNEAVNKKSFEDFMSSLNINIETESAVIHCLMPSLTKNVQKIKDYEQNNNHKEK